MVHHHSHHGGREASRIGPNASPNWTGLSATSSSSRSTLRASNVIELCPADRLTVETSVVAVPGYGTPPVCEWDVEFPIREAAKSLEFTSHLHMYIHEPPYNLAEDFSWEAFLKSGSALAEDLAKLSNEFPQRPIIFIAHSLGGVLLKKALLLAHQNVQDPRFQLVVACLSGILFLGTPHSGITDKDTLLCHNQVLYSCAKLAVQKQSTRLPDRDVFQLATLAASFQQIANIPILSVFESPSQRPNKHRFFGNKKRALATESLVTISSHAETLLGAHLAHSELCKLGMLEDNTYSAKDFLRSLFQALAKNEKWNLEVEPVSLAPEPLKPNPLNPLNLTLIVPVAKESDETSTQVAKQLAYKGWSTAQPSPQRLQRRSSLISTNSSRLVASRTAKLPCFELAHHSPNPDFVGRQEMFDIMDKHLLPRAVSGSGGMHSTRSFALCGMGGIGKTSLAVEYAFLRRDQFSTVFWIEAAGVSQLATDFSRISTCLGLETLEEAIDLESSKEIAKAWLNMATHKNGTEGDTAPQNPSWLLIFDNADNLDIIADYIPYHGNGSILVTSRDPIAKTHFFAEGSGIDMEPLNMAEAAGLLCNLVKPNGEAPSADEQNASLEVAQYLDGLPLAMSQMAGFIRKRQILIREFVDLYNNDTRYAEIHNVGNPIQNQRYGRTLASAYSLENFGHEATRLLQILAFLSPDRIREDIFYNPKTRQMAAKYPLTHHWTPSTFESARYELVTSSIIKRNLHKREIWIHRVIQAEVRARMEHTHKYAVFNEAIRLLATLWPPGDHCSQVTERWAICEDLLPHLERFYQLYNEHPDWEQYEVDPSLPMLMNEAAVYLHERCFSHEGKAYLKLALALCERAQITQEPLLSDMHLTMGALANETNDAETCLQHNVICLALRKAEAARTTQASLRLAFAHSQMGIAYMMTKKFALATDYFKQSVELLNVINADADDYGFPVCNLGLAYWVQGELEAADETLTNLLAQREEKFSKQDTVSYKTGRVLQALGNVRASKAVSLEEEGDFDAAQKLWDESFDIHSKCLVQYESTLGRFSHRAADCCHKLAEHHIRRKEHALAQNYLDRALSIWGDREWYKNESARSSFLRGTHLLSLSGKDNAELGNQWIERAKTLRAEILPYEEPKELSTADFDDIVCFWSI